MTDDRPLEFYALPPHPPLDWCSACGAAVPLPGLDAHRRHHRWLDALADAVQQAVAVQATPETP